MTCRRWCFTLNNWTEDEYKELWNRRGNFKYLIIGKETGQNGTPHLQGFGIYKHACRLTFIKNTIGARSHVEAAKGTSKQAAEYCKKDGNFQEHGEINPERNTGATLDDACQMCVDNSETGGYANIAKKYPSLFVKFYRGFKELASVINNEATRDFKTRVYFVWGPTGTGKSERCNEIARAFGSVYYKNRGQWWDNYRQETSVVIDDFYGWIKWDELLKICDKYPYRVQCKGSSMEFRSQHIFITSNTHFKDWYKFPGYDPAPFERRLDLIYDTNPLVRRTCAWECPNIEELNENIKLMFNIGFE